jgi:hypothetical protein
MKVLIKIGKDKIEERKDGTYVAGEKVSFSRLDMDEANCLLRIAGTPVQIATIKAVTGITVLSDDEARAIIKSKYPNSDLESLDVADPEVDEIAQSQGLKTSIRSDIQVPTRGNQVLQDQENYLMGLTCEKMKLTKAWWDKEVKNGKWATGKELEDDIKDGKSEAHEFTLSRMRTKFKGMKVSCDVPSKIAHDLSCLLVPDILPKDRKEITVEAAKAQLYSPCSICVPWI